MAGGMIAKGIIGGALSAAGQEMSDKQQIEDYRTQRNIALWNARVSRVQAEDARRQARFEATRQAEEAGYLQGLLEASLGGSGADMSVGAPLEIIGHQAAMFDLDRAIIAYEGEQQARQFESQAALDSLDAQQLDKAATELKRARYVRSAGAFFSGGGGDLFTYRPQQRERIQPQQNQRRRTVLGDGASSSHGFGSTQVSWRY